MAARAGTMSRGTASARTGPTRLATPRLDGEGDVGDDAEARAARETEAKRAALEEKRTARAARKAGREAEKERRKHGEDDLDRQPGDGEETEAETGTEGGSPRR